MDDEIRERREAEINKWDVNERGRQSNHSDSERKRSFGEERFNKPSIPVLLEVIDAFNGTVCTVLCRIFISDVEANGVTGFTNGFFLGINFLIHESNPGFPYCI